MIEIAKKEKELPYHASCNSLEDEACNNSTHKLGNPIEDACQDGDLASQSQSKGDSRINMTTRYIGANRHRHEQCKPMTASHSHQPRRI